MNSIGKHIYAVIMAGGGGERFWPKSRQANPKQFLSIFGPRTMLQETVARISRLVPRERIIVITTKTQAPHIRKQLPGIPPGSVIAEPFGRDTAACVALGCALVTERDPEGVMIVLPADHVIRDAKALASNLRDACRLAAERAVLVTLGIKPSAPATGYGYIRRGERLSRRSGTAFFKVREFTEKPGLATARRYVKSGRFFWNSGMFVWKASVIAGEFARHMPDLYRAYRRMREAVARPGRERALRRIYAGLGRASIDYGIMEKAQSVVVAEASFDWDDAGSWLALERHFPRRKDGNVVLGESVALNSERCIIVSDGGIVGCLGLKDVIVVRTPDAVLVCHRDAAQDLKGILQELKTSEKLKKYL